ncbi:MAG: LCP family protein [Actinomycetaceae bacterium]|nr:LCP family protein [Arcanobacterium sp.]MDD7504644.1 LCP family protein [Actinomycetaceae bacterium]MDY6142647.1 LCP family protein [Arcanobacterium sp.]
MASKPPRPSVPQRSREHASAQAHYTAPKHKKARAPLFNALRALGLIVLAMILGGGAFAGTLTYKLQNNITQHSLDTYVSEEERPEPVIPIDQKAGQPLNILLLGSDERKGASDIDGTGASGAVEGMRSDTTMLVHISADRSRINVISIPRDMIVDIPSCTLPNGDRTYRTQDMFNSAFMLGGITGDVSAAAACTLRTVEGMTGVLVDGYVVVDFASFKDVVNAIGGVDMCFAQDIDDPQANLKLTAGCHTLNGDEALGIARARKTLGDGSDLSRIGRQQELVFRIAEKILGMSVFTDAGSMYSMLGAVTRNLDTSEGLGNLDVLAGLMYSLRNIDSENINFVTMPFYSDPSNPNRVRPSAEAESVWEALRNDEPLPKLSPNGYERTQEEVVITNRAAPPDESGNSGTDGDSNGSDPDRSASDTTAPNSTSGRNTTGNGQAGGNQ